ncbi:MAG: choice-of-anchor Q domain-containing protein [Saonia sp.]
MRPYLYLIPIALLVTLWSSCRKDFDFEASTGSLEFSRDTVFLDTVFSNIGSSTYTLKVYNRSNDDLRIPNIRLGEGDNSSYRLNVDGEAGKVFQDVPILAKDSLFIFVETTFDIETTNETQFLYTDVIQFDPESNLQEVHLVTLIQDAVFLFPSELADGTDETVLLGLDEEGNEIRIEGFVLADNQLNFTNEKPYVIYGYAAVPEGDILSMDAGTRVHFHKDSGILVGQNASLKIRGELSTNQELLENEVIFEGDRLEPSFSDIPGQWGTIWLLPGSVAHEIDYLTLKNATVGLLVEGEGNLPSPDLTIKNSSIYNSATVNLWGRTATIIGENMVLGSAGNASLYCNSGGDYEFIHSTIANYWTGSFRSGAALQIDNFSRIDADQTGGQDLVKANFTNCIIDGNTSLELSLNRSETHAFTYNFTNCLIKFQDNREQFIDDPLYDFENKLLFSNILLNQNSDFMAPQDSDFRIMETSAAIDSAEPDSALLVPLDILGIDRTIAPDIGAYEFIPEN